MATLLKAAAVAALMDLELGKCCLRLPKDILIHDQGC